MRTRRALLRDALQIQLLIARFSTDGTLLPRSLPEICENIRDFVVVEDAGHIIGCGALHLYGMHLAEVRSIAVLPDAQGRGAGRRLLNALLGEAALQQVDCICLFTRIPEFFARHGFRLANRLELPDKIFKDCINCSRRHACDEIAMVRGVLPRVTSFPVLELPVLPA